jgi:energy-converting hydrogenase Eha subunit A
MESGGDTRWATYIELVSPGLVASHYTKLKSIDVTGSPAARNSAEWQRLLPTTIAKIGRAVMIQRILGVKPGDRVAEIGAGYAGFAAIFQTLYGPLDYTIYDLPEPCALQQKFLATCGLTAKIGDPDVVTVFDLVVSDYAFAELPYSEQKRYADNVIARSSKGTMTWTIMESIAADPVLMATNVLPLVRELMPTLDITWGPDQPGLDDIPTATTTHQGYRDYLLFWKNPANKT